MSDFKFTFTVLGDKLIERSFLRIAARTVDAAPAFELVIEAMRELERWQFDTEGAIGEHGAWQPLKLPTVEAKRRGGYDPRILRRTGDLVRSLTESGAPGSIAEVHPSWMRFGTEVTDRSGDYVYALAHQQGAGDLPARRIFDFRESDKVSFIKIIQRYLIMGEVGL